MTIRSELLALKNKDGVIVPETALVWAQKHPKSQLHQSINWDPDWNARAYLLVQIRNLITLHIRIDPRKPAAISLSIDRNEREGGGYREISDVLSVPRLRKVMLNDALHEIDLLQKRFEELSELELVWRAAEHVREQSRPRPSGRRKGGEDRPIA